ncbi:hypothetical protein H1S01_03250 [Heliobacterium chlorum]|uniref:Uncharacterized protein n=1 Tax=Heliobacterium chlorum TaxID=2698 RepID=A0ABR7SYB9_HELCL|nr:hypothetical protein [Heliobacterium chlorum]MBC9783528.1 hypothetical protein [Heliobacterium chlorum]
MLAKILGLLFDGAKFVCNIAKEELWLAAKRTVGRVWQALKAKLDSFVYASA